MQQLILRSPESPNLILRSLPPVNMTLKSSPTVKITLNGGSSLSKDKNFVKVLNGETSITINHQLGKYPSVTVIDSAGDEVVGSYRHLDINNTLLIFSSGFSGKAFFN